MQKFNDYIKCFIVIFIWCYVVVMTQTAQASCCLGDNNEDGIVSYEEVISGIDMFLGIDEVQNSHDEYGDGIVSIDELQNIVNRHLNGCESEDRYENDNTPENANILIEYPKNEDDIIVILPAMKGYQPFQNHNFHTSNDVDWIKLYCYQGEENPYYIDVYDSGADCDPVIEIYDENKKLLRPKIDQQYGGGTDETLEFQKLISKDAVYYMKIYHSKLTPYKEGGENYYKVRFRRFNDAPMLSGGVYGIVTPAVNGLVKTDLFGQSMILSGGLYYIFRPAGTYNLWVEVNGYSYSAVIKIGSAQYIRHDIQLRPYK